MIEKTTTTTTQGSENREQRRGTGKGNKGIRKVLLWKMAAELNFQECLSNFTFFVPFNFCKSLVWYLEQELLHHHHHSFPSGNKKTWSDPFTQMLTECFPGGSTQGRRRSILTCTQEMAPHSSILSKRTPWTEELGGLQSIESQSWTSLRVWAVAAHTIQSLFRRN